MPTSVPNFKFLAPLVTEIWKGSQNTKWALLISPDAPLAVKFLYVDIVPVNACQRTKFQLSSSINFGNMRWSQNKKWELLISPDVPQRTIFIHGAIVCVLNAYKCAKFQVPSSISYRDMEGIPENKVGAADLPRRPLAVKFLYITIVPANACQRTKFQLSSSISFGDMREVPK